MYKFVSFVRNPFAIIPLHRVCHRLKTVSKLGELNRELRELSVDPKSEGICVAKLYNHSCIFFYFPPRIT